MISFPHKIGTKHLSFHVSTAYYHVGRKDRMPKMTKRGNGPSRESTADDRG